MLTLDVKDPDSTDYPLDDELKLDLNVVYYQTVDWLTKHVETRGWQINRNPWDQEDIEFVCDTLSSFSSVFAREAFLLCLEPVDHRYVENEFYLYYVMARAFNRGAGKIGWLLDAVNNFIDFVHSKEKITSYKESIKKEIGQLAGQLKENTVQPSANLQNEKERLTESLHNIGDVSFLEVQAGKMIRVKKKYEKLYNISMSESFPVIYAVRIRHGWFYEFPKIRNKLVTDYLPNIQPVYPRVDIPPESIIARINFPNGIKRRDKDGFEGAEWPK